MHSNPSKQLRTTLTRNVSAMRSLVPSKQLPDHCACRRFHRCSRPDVDGTLRAGRDQDEVVDGDGAPVAGPIVVNEGDGAPGAGGGAGSVVNKRAIHDEHIVVRRGWRAHRGD